MVIFSYNKKKFAHSQCQIQAFSPFYHGKQEKAHFLRHPWCPSTSGFLYLITSKESVARNINVKKHICSCLQYLQLIKSLSHRHGVNSKLPHILFMVETIRNKCK